MKYYMSQMNINYKKRFIAGVYFACSMLLVSFSCLMTVVVLSMHYKGNHGKEMPQTVRTIFFDYIARVVCMKTVRQRARRCSIHPASVWISSLLRDIYNLQFKWNWKVTKKLKANYFKEEQNWFKIAL